jgi:PAS domain S-box-containing protein
MSNIKHKRAKLSESGRPPREILLSAENRLALVTETVTEGIYDWNVVTDALWVSDRLKAILGISDPHYMSRAWGALVHPDDLPSYKAAIVSHFKSETERLGCEYRIRRGSGDYFWIADSGRCIRGEDGRAVRLIGAIRDITRRKLAELKLLAASQAAEQARSQLNDALEAMSEGLVLFDAEDRIVICNSNYKRYFAVAGGEEVAQMVKPGALLWDIMRAAHEKGMFPLIKGVDIESHIERRKAMRRNPQSGTVEQNLSDGRWLQINEHRTADGGTASVYTDITDVKRREAELAKKTETLESLSSKLAKYLPPQVYRSIFTGEQSAEVAPKRKKLTIFFSDIAEFSNTVEELESEELTNLLNQYLTEMSKIALVHGATVDKFIGDAIVAFFGDPLSRGAQEDAIACVRMAIAMQRRMRELQSEWRARGLERAFELRVGITTGYCTVGNFGSEDRLDYTVIGNAVNLAARLQQHAERGAILMDNETRSLVERAVATEERGTIQVKGFTRPVNVFAVAGMHDDPQSRLISVNRDGVRLSIDRSKISEATKQETIAALKDAIARLDD